MKNWKDLHKEESHILICYVILPGSTMKKVMMGRYVMNIWETRNITKCWLEYWKVKVLLWDVNKC